MSDSSSIPQRIAKHIARSGLCSRRQAEELIGKKLVRVDGHIIDTPAIKVTPDQIITVDNKPLPEIKPPELWAWYKPTGYITSRIDPQGRPVIYDVLPKPLQSLKSVGRLDCNSEGLLLLTNDGKLAEYMMSPASKIKRTYRVKVHGNLKPSTLIPLRKGVTVDGIHYAPMDIDIQTSNEKNHWLVITITEGKNREIRRIMSSIRLKVGRLIRTSYGPVTLNKLAAGDHYNVSDKIVNELVNQIAL